MFCMLKEKKYIQLFFQNIIQIVKNKLFLNDFKQSKMLLTCSEKKRSALLRETTSKNNGDFYCLNCLHFSNKLELHKRACKKKRGFCNVNISSGDTKIPKIW